MAPQAVDPLMRPIEGEARIDLVIEPHRLPLGHLMTALACDLAGRIHELADMWVVVATGTGRGRFGESDPSLPGGRLGALVAVAADRADMPTLQGKVGAVVVELDAPPAGQ